MGGDKVIDECRRLPAPYVASQSNMIMEGLVSKQTNKRNWPARFAFLTSGLLFVFYFFDIFSSYF